jgi:activating signal cointegrator complex subunit 2
LQESTPFYLPMREIFHDSPAVIEIYEKIANNVLIIVCRLITNRESDVEFMTKEKQAEIVYKNYVITVPMIFDMIALYGHDNKDLLQKIISTILKIEPKYLNDFKTAIKFVQSTFIKLKTQLGVVEKENRDLYEKYEDLSLYLMNIAVTLNITLELLPNEVKIYCSRDLHFEQSIANFYDNFIAQLYLNSREVDETAWFLTYINYARVEMINTFRNLLNRSILAIFNASEKNRIKIADEILSVFTESAGFHLFIADYIKLYPIENDLDVITQSGKKM